MKIELAPSRAGARPPRAVGLHAVVGRLLDVRHVLEVVVALRRAGGAAEVVDRDRRVAALGEAKRELLVEAVEPAHVGQDHDPGRGRLVGRCEERGEFVAVGGGERQVVVRDCRARDGRDRRGGVDVEAHAETLLQRQLGAYTRAAAGRALDVERAVERRHAVAEPAQARAGERVGAALAVVLDDDDDAAVVSRTRTAARVASAYFATFVSASETM